MLKDDFFKDIDYNRLPPEPGRLLISEPFLYDTFFKRTVVLLVENNEEGAVGFILNKPINLKLNELVEGFPPFESEVHFGGPVSEDNLFYLHTIGEELEHSKEVMDGLWWGGNYEQLKFMAENGLIEPAQVRVFVGYSGWGELQLQDELNQLSWIVADTNTSQVMSPMGEDFWNHKLKAMGNKFAAIANFPEDPSLN